MKHIKFRKSVLLALVLGILSCKENQGPGDAGKRNSKAIFPKGEIVTNDNFTGTVYVHSLIEGDSFNPNSVGNVTFAPGARSKWHSHPAGQILLATEGLGYYQEKGKGKMILRKGDVIKCPPNLPHWHGASAKEGFTQVAITGRGGGPTVWLEAVTDEEYNKE